MVTADRETHAAMFLLRSLNFVSPAFLEQTRVSLLCCSVGNNGDAVALCDCCPRAIGFGR